MTSVYKLPDHELLTLLRDGSELALTEIYNRYWNKLLAIAYNHTRDKQAAEEIVQNLFIGLWNRKDNLHINSLDRYLATAVKFAVFKEYYRKQKREAGLLSKLSFKDEHHIEEQITAKFLQQFINGIVETLPEKCRLVFKLSREQHLSNAEIAGELDIAEKTVEMHMTKALKTIRTELNGSGAIAIVMTGIAHHWLK